MEPTFITIIQGDHGFDWNFTLTDAQGSAVNIAGTTLSFIAQLISDSSVNFSNAMSIVDGPSGKCKYTVLTDDFIVPGTYNAQISVKYISGEIFSFGDITIVVEPSLPTT